MHFLASGLLLSSLAAGERLLHDAFKTPRSEVDSVPTVEVLESKPSSKSPLKHRAVKISRWENGYEMSIEYPVLMAAHSQAVPPKGLGAVNKQIAAFINEQKHEFWEADYREANPALFSCEYELSLLTPKFASIRFCFGVPGGAHPNTYLKTLTFDLEDAHQISLAELFTDEVPYNFISDYCRKDLKNQLEPIGEGGAIETGTDPDPSNFNNFLLTGDGLEVCFDTYQVASYAAGQQRVRIPYSALMPFIQDSPLVASGLLEVVQ
jgi:hypothetical protein